MKTRIGALLICVSVIISCNSHTESPGNNNIIEFERLLGKKESQNLNEIIDEFGKFLEDNYEIHPDSSLFKHYLINIQRIGRIDFVDLDTSRFYRDNLFNQYTIEFPDSIWIIDSIMYTKYPSLPIEKRRVPPAPPNKEAVEAWIVRHLNYADIRISHVGSYFSALDSIKNNDTLIKVYLDNRYAIGSISPGILANGLLRHMNEESEYFCKRIYVMELLELEKIMILTKGNKNWRWR